MLFLPPDCVAASVSGVKSKGCSFCSLLLGNLSLIVQLVRVGTEAHDSSW